MPALRHAVVALLVAAAPALSANSARADERAAAPKPVIVPPRLERFVEAPYPPEAARDGVEGAVLLQLDLDANGAVTKATVVEPAGHGLDEAAVEAARQLVFSPATRDGVPVAARIRYRYAFTLKPAPAEEAPAPPATGALRGTIVAAGTAEGLAGVRVVVRGAAGVVAEATTDESGAWSAPPLAPGVYRVTASAPGFEPAAADEEVVAGTETAATYRLAPLARAAEVIVKGEPPPREVTRRTLTQRELSRIPGTNGDALRAIQTMPGVGRSPGVRGVLLVRGSAPQDTAIFVDGVEIPIVYHFGGLSSVVPTEMIEKLDFYPGNFSARYGRAMGGIVDVGTLAAKPEDRWHGLAQADFIDARMLAEGPLPFAKDWKIVVAGRRSYVDLWLKPILARGNAGVTAAPVYWDWQAFVEHRPTERSRLRLGIFGSDDSLSVFRTAVAGQVASDAPDLTTHTGFARLQGSYEIGFGASSRFRTVLAYGYDLNRFESGTRQVAVTTHPVVSRSELSIGVAPGWVLHVGEDVQYVMSDVDVTRPIQRRPGEPDSGPTSDQQSLTERDAPRYAYPAFYAELEARVHPRVLLVPGFRADWASSTKRWDLAPRINGRWDLVKTPRRTTLKGGVGLFFQPPQAQEVSPVFGSTGLASNRAIHGSIGVEQELAPQIDLSVEGFYKDLSSLVARAPAAAGYAYGNGGSGWVAGSELLLRYRPDERFFGWLAYTLSRSMRRESEGAEAHLFQYDQTHILTALGSYRIGGGWELGARFRYVSGNPYTPCLGGVQNGATGGYVCVSGAPFSGRLPPFHELDVRVDKHWYFASWQLSAYLDLLNAYNRGNPEGVSYNFDYSQQLHATGLPIIPSLGVRGEF